MFLLLAFLFIGWIFLLGWICSADKIAPWLRVTLVVIWCILSLFAIFLDPTINIPDE
jgi:hypothetical protein